MAFFFFLPCLSPFSALPGHKNDLFFGVFFCDILVSFIECYQNLFTIFRFLETFLKFSAIFSPSVFSLFFWAIFGFARSNLQGPYLWQSGELWAEILQAGGAEGGRRDGQVTSLAYFGPDFLPSPDSASRISTLQGLGG